MLPPPPSKKNEATVGKLGDDEISSDEDDKDICFVV